MKTSRLAARAAASLATCAFVSAAAFAETEALLYDPPRPTGVLSAFPTMVQTGTHPTLDWTIIHPARISPPPGGGGGGGGGNGSGGSKDLGVISPPGTLIPNEDVYVTVQIIGTEPTDCVRSNSVPPPPTDLRMSVNGSSYFQLFYGTQENVDPAHELYTKKISKGQSINFGGRYVVNGGWSPFVTTRNANLQVVTLVNGDTFPAALKFQGQGQGQVAPFLKPYLDSDYKVRLGPLSALVVMELAQTNHTSPCFDYQDQVVLVTFSRKHPNNGHGNNLDGVDVSNPGKGSGGPNGAVDPSGDVDDER